MTVERRCCKPGCKRPAVATLTFVYSDSTAVIGPLSTSAEPHTWDMCAEHAGRITAPRGWELVRYEGQFPDAQARDEADLTALADSVRERELCPDEASALASRVAPQSFTRVDAPSGFRQPSTGRSGGGGYSSAHDDHRAAPSALPQAPSATPCESPGATEGGRHRYKDNKPPRQPARRGHLRVLPDPVD